MQLQQPLLKGYDEPFNLYSKLYKLALLFVTLLLILAPKASFAEVKDSFSKSHLAQARETITALKATDQFDMILPELARALKIQLTGLNPDRAHEISEIVDKETIDIARKRVELERKAAQIYAKHFTEAELKAISTFYNSPIGKKLLQEAPQTFKEMFEAGNDWKDEIAKNLSERVTKIIEAKQAAKTAKK